MAAQIDSPDAEFAGKVVLIPGSSNGIGRVVAMMFADRGAKVAIVSSSSVEKANKVRDEIVAAGGQAEAFTANIAKVKEVEALIAAVVQKFSTIDILVNSAGTHFATYMGDTTEDEFDRLSDVNLKGAYFLMNSVAPILKEKGSGKIINITAQMADIPMSGMALYSATKAAVKSLTAAAAWELGPYGINCNAVAPGHTMTPEIEQMADNTGYADVIQWFFEMTPSKRKVSTAVDIGNLILFLASEKSNSMYGETLVADEGMTRAWKGHLSSGAAIFADSTGTRRKIES